MLTTIAAFFLFGSAWFWITLAVAWIVITAATENDRGAIATFALAAMTVLFLSGNHDWLRSIMAHPWRTIAFFVGYFVAGALWGIVKWYVYVRNRTERIKESQQNYMREYGLDKASMTATQQKAMWQFVENDVFSYHDTERNPQKGVVAAKNKTRILTWMTYWPWSLIWTMINDPIRHIFRQIYYRMSAMLQRIADRAAASVALPDAVPDEPPADDDTPMLALRNRR